MKVFKIIMAVVCAVALFVSGYVCGKPGSEFLNMETVVGYEATEHGILLHTEDGNGYFIEK